MFTDRKDAALRLAEVLETKNYSHPVVLALPRGGVPLGRIIADRLNAPLDVLLVKKLGAPGNPELAVGAIGEISGADEPVLFINESAARMVGAHEEYLKREIDEKLAQIRARRALYGHGGFAEKTKESWAQTTAIIIDDGIATGATISAAIKLMRAIGAARIVVGAPVGPTDTVARLGDEADEVICLETPDPFYAISMHYQIFDQVDDEEVIALLDKSP